MQRHPFAVQIFHIIDSLENIAKPRTPTYPPMDMIRTGENSVELHFAVAGFTQSDIEITTEKNILRVKASLAESEDLQYIHRGIAKRAFDHRFELASQAKVVEASFVNGLLKIKVEAVIPEEQKLKKIELS